MGDALSKIIERISSGSTPAELMSETEASLGRKILRVGLCQWLPFMDWRADGVVSLSGDEVHIIAIAAKRPGTGAFRRMVTQISSAGLTPVVVEPFAHMSEIMKAWGWRQEVRQYPEGEREEWRPSNPDEVA